MTSEAKPGCDGAHPSHICANVTRNGQIGRAAPRRGRTREGFAPAERSRRDRRWCPPPARLAAVSTGGLLVCGLLIAIFAAGCQTPAEEIGRVKVVAIADTCPTNGFTVVRKTNIDALSSAGYLPVVIPRLADTNLLAAAMDRADALLLVGGTKEQDYEGRIRFELLLMRMAIERGMPILGFCHGHQCINRYFGGTLDSVAKASAGGVVHRGKLPPSVKDCFHMIDIKPGSRLAKGFGATRVEVNTSHTRCIGKVGEGLEVTARADDGIIEAVEHRTLPITGFQFHPERIFRRDPRYLRIIIDALERRGD